MMRNRCGLFLALPLVVLFAGCGGSGGNPPPATLSITTLSLPSGQTTVPYNTTLLASGGTEPYKWSIVSGTLPAGLSLSTAGVIAGTPTTAGQASLGVQVTDSASSPQSSTATLALSVSGGTLKITSVNAAPGTVGTAYSFQMTASGGVPPYTWAVASGSQLPADLQMNSSGLITGTPTASGAFSPNLQVTDTTTNNTATQNVNFSINPTGPPLPDGNYVFEFDGNTPSSNAVEINGAFQVQKGVVAIGSYNENVLNQAPMLDNLFTGGSVTVPTNGLGQLVLTLPSGNLTFALAVPASALTTGNDTDIRIIEFDDTTGKGMRGSGVLKAASAAAPPTTITGGYAFGLHGFDTHSQPAAVAGSFQANANGTISGGEVDINDNGDSSNYTGVTGTYSVNSIGEVTVTLALASGNTVHYSFYEASPTEMLAISTDNTTSSTTPLLVGGSVLQQSGGLSDASLSGANVLALTGSAFSSPAYIPDITLGLVTITGSGSLTATYDEYKGALAPQSYSGTYSVDPATGRVTIVASGTPPSPPPIFYLVSGSKAFVLGTDASTSSGLLEKQSGAPFMNSSFSGNYLGGTISFPKTDVVSLVAANGAGGVQYTYNASGSSGLLLNQTLSGTYTVDATGRTVVTISGDTTPRIFYVVSPTKAVYLSGEYGGYLGSFEQ